MVFTGIRFSIKLNIFTIFLILIVESPHILSYFLNDSGEVFELAFNSIIIFSNILSLLLTEEIKKRKEKAEAELKTIKDRAEMYNLVSIEEEDLIAHIHQQAIRHDEEISEIMHAIKESLYGDGAHLFTVNHNKTAPEIPLFIHFSTDSKPVIYPDGIVHKVVRDGVPRFIKLNQKGLSPGYACGYNIK